MTAYEKSLTSKRMTPGHRGQIKHVLSRVRKHQPDVPMSEVDYAFLDKLADFWKARPPMKNGNPIAPDTVLITLRTCRTFFTWADDTTWSGWEGPRKLTRPFACERNDLMTATEVRASATIEQFTVADLAKLYKAGNDRDRVIMLTALFSAGTQMELSVMTKAEFDLDAGTLDHYALESSYKQTIQQTNEETIEETPAASPAAGSLGSISSAFEAGSQTSVRADVCPSSNQPSQPSGSQASVTQASFTQQPAQQAPVHQPSMTPDVRDSRASVPQTFVGTFPDFPAGLPGQPECHQTYLPVNLSQAANGSQPSGPAASTQAPAYIPIEERRRLWNQPSIPIPF